jgi:hypothetical protein
MRCGSTNKHNGPKQKLSQNRPQAGNSDELVFFKQKANQTVGWA